MGNRCNDICNKHSRSNSVESPTPKLEDLVSGKLEEGKKELAPSHSDFELMNTISTQDTEILNSALNSHFILSKLSLRNKNYFIKSMKRYEYGPNETIFELGDKGDNFYVIASGEVEVIINRTAQKTLTEGESFGELALIDHCSRTATIKTLKSTVLWGLDRHTFRQGIQEINKASYSSHKKLVQGVPFFKDLNEEQIDRLISILIEQKYSKNTRIITQGEVGDLSLIHI